MAKIAVVMPVFNGDRFLGQAIESVLTQSCQDFRFIIVDDGSTDSSVKTIKSYHDRRIVLLEIEKNMGIASSLNRAIRLVDEEFIARMDCDDVCHPDRLQQQVRFMQRNESIGICGTWYKAIDSVRRYEFRGPCKAEEIGASMVFSNPIAHPTVMMRTHHMRQNRLEYSLKAEPNEDYDLWQRASECFPLANIPEILLYYRIHQESVSRCIRKSTPENSMRVLESAYWRGLGWLGVVPADTELQLHFEIANRQFLNMSRLPEYESWLAMLKRKNREERRFDTKIFDSIIRDTWFEVCYAVAKDQPRAMATYFGSRLRNGMIMPRECKLVLKSLLDGRRTKGLK